jgi:hypothetical protein
MAVSAARMADWTGWQVGLTFAATVLLFITLVLNSKATNAAVKQAEIAARDLIERGRPQFEPSIPGGDSESLIRSMNTREPPFVMVRFENVGGRTAIIQRSGGTILTGEGESEPPLPDDESLVLTFPFVGHGDAVPVGKFHFVTANRGYLEWEPDEIDKITRREVMVYVVAYVAYTDGIGGLWECGAIWWYWPVRSTNRNTGETKIQGYMRLLQKFDRRREEKKP